MSRLRAVVALLVVVCAACADSTPARAATGRQLPIGLRAIAMGGAAVAAREDVSAIFWNPAGLAALDHQEIAGTRADLFDTGFRNDDIGLALPLARGRTLGLGWFHSGTEDTELEYSENRLDLAAGFQVHPRVSVGATFKYLTRSLDLDGLDSGRGQGIGIDLGAQALLLKGLWLGAALQDLTGSRIEYDQAGSITAYERSFRAGVDWQPAGAAHLAFQLDDQWRIGGEFKPHEVVALRGGLRQSLDAPESPIWTVGAGLRMGPMRFDYAREMHPYLDDTEHFGLSAAFQFNPSLLAVEAVEIDDIYLSLYSQYALEPPVVARVRNKSDEPLEVQLKLEIPGITRTASEHHLLLRPGVATEVSLPLLLDRAVLDESGDRRVEARVTASYVGPRLVRHESRATTGFVYGPGAIDWDRGVEQVAAYVTTRDPALAAWAREVIRGVTPDDTLLFGSGQLAGTAALFAGLRRSGLRYVPDPLNPYAAVSRATGAVDVVHYPRETLRIGSGDCDDTAVLMISLLHNIGTETRLVDLPGHLMILVDTGLPPGHRRAFEPEPARALVADGRLWIPLETTALEAGFEAGWRRGAEVFADESARGRVRLVDIVAAQRRYAAPAFGADVNFPVSDSLRAAVRRDMARDGDAIDVRRRARAPGGFEPSPADNQVIFNTLAGLEWRAGRHAEARRTLQRVLTESPEARGRRAFNLALIEIEAGNLEAALDALGEARRALPEDVAVAELERFLVKRPAPGAIGRPAGLAWKE